MANLKSITELPVAESADGLNLIVNENGAAKQIAASAVGAQADFAVTDETSPAFIKNKPAVVQADWAEEDITNPAFIKNKPAVAQADWSIEDSSNPAFIKNRPFYDTREIETVTLTFDGDLTGKDFVLLDDTYGAVKISNKVPKKEDLIGGTYSGRDGMYSWSYEIVEDMIYSPAYGVIDVDNMLAIVYPEGVSDEVPFTEGIWSYCGLEDDTPVFYATEISWNNVVSGELKTIEPKYVKDMYYSTQFEDVEILAETTQTPDNGWIYLQEPMVGLVENGVYTVNWNGVKYVCDCNYDSNYDKYSLWSEAFSITYTEWMLGQQGYYAEIEVYDGSTSVTLSIVGSYEEVKKIDEKYISDSVWQSIDNAYDTANHATSIALNKMSRNDPTGTGSFSLNRKSGTTIGTYSHAEGSNTTASGSVSHAEGTNTTASGNYSHAEGWYTTAQTRSQHVQGEYNILDTKNNAGARGTYVHIVGNGTSDTKRSNAHTVDWSGNAWYQGTVEGTGFILASPDGTRYKITVANDGTLSAVAV